MDQSMLLLLALAVAIAVAALAVSRSRRASAHAGPADSPLAVSTEGMKVCPRCGMGSSWMARTCSQCGAALKG